MTQVHTPIGVFDSGIGGLSILQALRAVLPAQDFVYFSDAGHAPYGERSDAFIAQRCLAVTEALVQAHHLRALVVACNTATTVAIQALRARFPSLPIIGVEPAIKPAAQATQTGHVAVLATERTLHSRKYQALRCQLAPLVTVTDVACAGLAAAIENDDTDAIERLSAHYMQQAIHAAGLAAGRPVDTVVLGCTHYPLIRPVLQRQAPGDVRLIDSAVAVARQTVKRLQEQKQEIAPEPPDAASAPGALTLETSGDLAFLQAMAARHLGAPPGQAVRDVSADGGGDDRHARPSRIPRVAGGPVPAS